MGLLQKDGSIIFCGSENKRGQFIAHEVRSSLKFKKPKRGQQETIVDREIKLRQKLEKIRVFTRIPSK